MHAQKCPELDEHAGALPPRGPGCVSGISVTASDGQKWADGLFIFPLSPGGDTWARIWVRTGRYLLSSGMMFRRRPKNVFATPNGQMEPSQGSGARRMVKAIEAGCDQFGGEACPEILVV